MALHPEVVEFGDDGAYVASDAARWVPEPPKTSGRSAFQRDRARVVHSAGLRRLGAKTQVMGPSSDDFVRTRLTHSLEVAQVGRELGNALGCNPDVVDAACLAHDLGHPPFGHNGERALAEVARGIGGFEGNAQTLRLLTRLEAKAAHPDGTSAGLNLSRASLDAVCKYPWAAGEGPPRRDGTPNPKFGVYADDAAVFAWLRTGAVPGRRCLEADVMDLSDDISYSVHDVEDGIAAGRIDPTVIPREVDRIVEATTSWYRGAAGPDAIHAALLRLMAEPWWVGEFHRSRGALAALKDMTSQLIGRFCGDAERATRAVHGTGRLTRYNAALVVPEETAAEILALKGLAVTYVMAPRELEPLYLTQRTVLFDLVDTLMDAGEAELEAEFAGDFRAASTADERLRVVVDQVSSLTDHSAHQWHARLRGMLSTAW